MPFASQKQKKFLKWKFPKVYEKFEKEELKIKGSSRARGHTKTIRRKL